MASVIRVKNRDPLENRTELAVERDLGKLVVTGATDSAGENGWPTSSVLEGEVPKRDEDKERLVDALQDWKTNKYQEMISERTFMNFCGKVWTVGPCAVDLTRG